MIDMCNDNRFELVAKYKAELMKSTNIEMSADEMAVLDNTLFRMWQIGWLDRLEQPTVDVVRVVRCRDCEYYVETNGGIGICELTISGAKDDGFCAWGERKNDE